MALPQTVNPSTPAGSDSPAQGDDWIRSIKNYLIDIIGVPSNQAVTSAMGSMTTAGAYTFSASPLTVPTLLQGTASQMLRIESQYSNLALGVNGASILSVNSGGVAMHARNLEWMPGVTAVIGTVSGEPLILKAANVDRWMVNPSGVLQPLVTNVVDIGSVAGPNPRNIYAVSNLVIGGNIQWGNNILPAMTTIRGDVLYRGQSHWLNLAAGLSGQVLRTQSSSADPLWVTGGSGVEESSNPVTWTGRHDWSGAFNFRFTGASSVLGIGTSTPTHMFHVHGRAYVGTNLYVNDFIEVPRVVAPTSPVTGLLRIYAASHTLGSLNLASVDPAGTTRVYGTNPTRATQDVTTTETTTSTSYTDLATPGPAITLTPGRATDQVIVVTADIFSGTAGGLNLMSIAIAAAAASDADALIATAAVINSKIRASAITMPTDVVSGATHTAKYRVSANTGSFDSRRITAWTLS